MKIHSVVLRGGKQFEGSKSDDSGPHLMTEYFSQVQMTVANVA